jgi:hypothetical protein
MTKEIEKKKRGRPRLNPIVEEAVKPKKVKEVKVVTVEPVSTIQEPNYKKTKSSRHMIDEIIDYLDEHVGTLENNFIAKQMQNKGWNRRYIIYKALMGCFNLQDKTFDGEKLK